MSEEQTLVRKGAEMDRVLARLGRVQRGTKEIKELTSTISAMEGLGTASAAVGVALLLTLYWTGGLGALVLAAGMFWRRKVSKDRRRELENDEFLLITEEAEL